MNNLFKRGIVRLRTGRNLKQRFSRENEDFRASRRIGIVCSDQFETEENIRSIISDLKRDGKEVSVLVYCHNPKKIQTSYPHFKASDISVSGEFRNDSITFFIGQTYDFAICLDESNHYLINYVFSSLIAKCRVGICQPARSRLFDMMVQHTHTNQTPVSNEVLKYLKMIHT